MTDRTMPDAHPLQSGDPRRLGGYEVLGRLGEGGQGAVFLGRPEGATTATDHVAIKLLHGGLTGDGSARARFVRELEVAKRVARFCTAQVLDADVLGDQPYIISEYVPGLSLHRVVREEGPRRGGALERLAISTLTALTAIHQAGIVHRDFKPHNVMMGPDGPRVIDFGVSRALGAAGETQNVGTPAYMAPENFTGAQVGPAADMFAWGTTMVFAATGRPAFGNDELATVMHRILTGEPDLGDLASPIRELVVACLDKDPARRPTARAAQERLVGAASGAAPDAPPHAAPPPLPAFPGPQAPPPQGVGPQAATPHPAGPYPPGVQVPGPYAAARPGAPSDQFTDPRHAGTAPQPDPFGGVTPPPGPGYPHAGPGLPPPGRPDGPRRGRQALPIAAAVAVALVMGAGGAWAAMRSGGDDGGDRPAAFDDRALAQDGTAGRAGPTEKPADGKSTKPSPTETKKSAKPTEGSKSAKSGNGGARPKPNQSTGSGAGTGTGGGGSGGGGSAPDPEPANKYTPQQACGGGYSVLRSMSVSGGTAYLLYSNSTKKNCAVTMKTRNVGTNSSVSTFVQAQGGSRVSDGGSFAWYAGPVYVHAPGMCVRFGGNGGTSSYGNCG
ncbi:serine/threonine protein kinase [Actinomadura algeriensis]|uniref:Membrane protein YgcG n=1 Tax=Actinomadura algeriensis TaxID=1679523 RepID=A0ABR9JTH4_9ACTN|nr:serine/threonine-protein kinase [Actinomadura algeriensis]MBE1533862.1 putative membrane protein YgcG [Actinomadura algeriensis]